jgi:hypothetical protein
MNKSIPSHILERLHPSLQSSQSAVYMPDPASASDEQIKTVLPDFASVWREVSTNYNDYNSISPEIKQDV